jgi:ADP-heptose:LPS heptosyltransferase
MAKGWACLCRFGGIGDNLIASAVLPGLKAKYGKIEVITQEPQHVVFENSPYIDKLAVYKAGDLPDGEEWHKWFSRRAKEYDFLANLSHSCESMRALFRGQSQYYWSDKFRRKFCGASYLETVGDICDVPYDTLAPRFFPTDIENKLAISTKLKYGLGVDNKRPVIGWVISGTRIDKVYPWTPMAVARLIREIGQVILLGGPTEKELSIAKMVEDHVKQQNGTTNGLLTALSSPEIETWPIRRILTMAMHCDIVIGPDTGPMWAVSMCDMPKIMLLSHASPENITKYWNNTITLHADPKQVNCWPCHRLIDLPEHCRVHPDANAAACISDITVEKLIATVNQAWRKTNVRNRASDNVKSITANHPNSRKNSKFSGNAHVEIDKGGPSHPAS